MERWKDTCFWISYLYLLFLVKDSVSVVVTDVLLTAGAGKNFVLQGEPATLTCHYILEPTELVTEVEWEKDGALVYLWLLDSEPVVKDVLEGKVDTTVQSPSVLSITSTSMDMDGTYTCRVRTNGKTADNKMYLMVIVDACDESVWKTHTDMIECTETINMHCVGMFPKPSPACGVYSEKLGKYLNSVPYDTANKLLNGTYELSFSRRFEVQDWLNHTDLSFRCNLMIMGSSWRRGIKHKMFGEPGCQKSPPDVENGYYNLTEEVSCWNFSAEGVRAEYHCDNNYELLGSSLYTCTDGQWTSDGVIVDEDNKKPMCVSVEINAGRLINGENSFMLAVALYFVAWILFP